MTGEITLSGRVLPVGGIKEKVLAARRVGVREVIVPARNQKNIVEDLNEELRREMKVHLVNTIQEVLDLALLPAVEAPRPIDEPVAGAPAPEAGVVHTVDG
jgi:ATP-dependent Lon protease